MYKILNIVISQFFICFSLVAQDLHFSYRCGDIIHGRSIYHYNIIDDCNSKLILITSYIEDGSGGTEVSGDIRSRRIWIKPGFSRVRLVPIRESYSLPNEHKRGSSAGGNGNAGSRSFELFDISMSNNNTSNPLVLYPNPVIDYLHIKVANELKIIGFDLLSADGISLKQEIMSPTDEISFSTMDLNAGIYFIHVRLEDGEYHYKTILKQ